MAPGRFGGMAPVQPVRWPVLDSGGEAPLRSQLTGLRITRTPVEMSSSRRASVTGRFVRTPRRMLSSEPPVEQMRAAEQTQRLTPAAASRWPGSALPAVGRSPSCAHAPAAPAPCGSTTPRSPPPAAPVPVPDPGRRPTGTPSPFASTGISTMSRSRSGTQAGFSSLTVTTTSPSTSSSRSTPCRGGRTTPRRVQ